MGALLPLRMKLFHSKKRSEYFYSWVGKNRAQGGFLRIKGGRFLNHMKGSISLKQAINACSERCLADGGSLKRCSGEFYSNLWVFLRNVGHNFEYNF